MQDTTPTEDALPVQTGEKEKANEVLTKIEINDLFGKNGLLHVGTLVVVNPTRPILAINCGDGTGFVTAVKQSIGVKGIMWNEYSIGVILEDRHTVLRYEPATHPYADLFFVRQKDRSNDEDQMIIWEGEFEPVQFSKQNLLKFLSLVEIVDAPKEVIESIKNMKILEQRKQEDMIGLGDDTTKMTIEETMQTNLPRRFSLMIPVSENYTGRFEFEAKVAKKKKRYGGTEENKKVIVLRCLNARQVLRDRMEQVLKMLPPEIPKFYGKMVISGGKEEHW